MIARIVLRNGEEHWGMIEDVGKVVETIAKITQADEGLAFYHFTDMIAKPGTIRFTGVGQFGHVPPTTDLIVALDQISHIEVAEETNVPRSL